MLPPPSPPHPTPPPPGSTTLGAQALQRAPHSNTQPHTDTGHVQNRTRAFLQNTFLSHTQFSHLRKRHHHSARCGALKSGQDPPFPSCPLHSHPIHTQVLSILAPKYSPVFTSPPTPPLDHSNIGASGSPSCPIPSRQTDATPPAKPSNHRQKSVLFPASPPPSHATHHTGLCPVPPVLTPVLSPPPRERPSCFPHLG